MQSLPDDDRKKQIAALYRNILEREPDVPGLKMYYESDLAMDEIERDIENSLERQALVRKRQSGGQTKTLRSKEKLLIGDHPSNESEVHRIIEEGIDVIFNVGQEQKTKYDPLAFLEAAGFPVSLSDIKSLEKGLEFLHQKCLLENKRVYMHASGSMESCVILASMFTAVSSGRPFTRALYRILLGSGGDLALDRKVITAEVVKVLTNFRKKALVEPSGCVDCSDTDCGCCKEEKPPESKIIKIKDTLYVGKSPCNKEELEELASMGITTLVSVCDHYTYDDFISGNLECLSFPVREFNDLLEIKKLVKAKVAENAVLYLHAFNGEQLVLPCIAALSVQKSSLEDIIRIVEERLGNNHVNEKTLEAGLKLISV